MLIHSDTYHPDLSTASHIFVQTKVSQGMETTQTSLQLRWFSYLSFPNAGITGISHKFCSVPPFPVTACRPLVSQRKLSEFRVFSKLLTPPFPSLLILSTPFLLAKTHCLQVYLNGISSGKFNLAHSPSISWVFIHIKLKGSIILFFIFYDYLFMYLVYSFTYLCISFVAFL